MLQETSLQKEQRMVGIPNEEKSNLLGKREIRTGFLDESSLRFPAGSFQTESTRQGKE